MLEGIGATVAPLRVAMAAFLVMTPLLVTVSVCFAKGLGYTAAYNALLGEERPDLAIELVGKMPADKRYDVTFSANGWRQAFKPVLHGSKFIPPRLASTVSDTVDEVDNHGNHHSVTTTTEIPAFDGAVVYLFTRTVFSYRNSGEMYRWELQESASWTEQCCEGSGKGWKTVEAWSLHADKNGRLSPENDINFSGVSQCERTPINAAQR